MNKLLRVSGPSSYRLMALELSDGVWIGETRGGDTLKDDIANYGRGQTYCKPLYAVFVRPRLTPPSPMGGEDRPKGETE